MTETSHAPVDTAQLAASPVAPTDGPHADAGTTGAGEVAAEIIRYLCYAAAKGVITDSATIAALTASLATAAHRLPELLHTISEWLSAETIAGCIADDHRRSPDQLTVRTRAATAHAADSAAELGVALAAIHNLMATLHTAEAPGPAI